MHGQPNVKLCNSVLHMILVCMRRYLKSLLRYRCLTLDTYHPNILYLREKNLRIRGYFSKPKRAREQKKFGKHWLSDS
jgi:hypothetical protein